jgi:hypothetical protein
MSDKKSREEQEAAVFAWQQEDLREITRLNDDFELLFEKFKQSLENYHKRSPEEKKAANARIAKYRKMSKEEQRQYMAKLKKLSGEMDSPDARKPS